MKVRAPVALLGPPPGCFQALPDETSTMRLARRGAAGFIARRRKPC